jgi:hypothetical protein
LPPTSEIRALDQRIAAHLLPQLGRRPVGHQRLAIADPHGRGQFNRLKLTVTAPDYCYERQATDAMFDLRYLSADH